MRPRRPLPLHRSLRLKPTLLVLLLSLAGCSTFHWSDKDEDQWFAFDKAEHFTLSAAGAWVGTAATQPSLGTPRAAATGFTISLSLGILKEAWDSQREEGWSWKDLAWDTAGAITGTWLGTAVH